MRDQVTRDDSAAPHSIGLTTDEAQDAFDALGFWSSDDNDAPHDRIATLRERLERAGAKRIGANPR